MDTKISAERLDITGFEKLCRKLTRMTDLNYHTEAVLKLAEWIKENCPREGSLVAESEKYCRWCRFIADEHKKVGYMPHEMIVFRNNILFGLLDIAKRVLPAEYYEKLSRSF